MEEKYMKLAIEEAKKGIGSVKKNPLVGAVIVKGERIISTGYHAVYGREHAEENAINNAKESVEGATMYVTLEPCSHFGKRPPCANLLIEKKLKKVIVGLVDPNPKVSGNGIKLLRDAGIEVEVGMLEEECKKLNEVFLHHIIYNRPFVVMKSAMTLDGKTATITGDSQWISCEESRIEVHRMRSVADAIMVGINTVLSDNPSLNVRHIEGKDPIRIVVDSRLSIPIDAKLLHLKSSAKTIIACTINHDKDKFEQLSNMKSVEVIIVDDDHGHVDLSKLMDILYEKEIYSILLEGGATLNYEMISHGLVAKLYIFIAPKIIGGKNALTPLAGSGIEKISDSIELRNMEYRRIGQDLLVEAKVCLPE